MKYFCTAGNSKKYICNICMLQNSKLTKGIKKDLNKSNTILHSRISRLNIVAILHMLINRLSVLPIKVPTGFLGRNLQADSEMYVEKQKNLSNRNNFEKQNKVGKLTLSESETSCKAALIEACGFGDRTETYSMEQQRLQKETHTY